MGLFLFLDFYTFISFPETFHAAGGIDQFLLAGEEWVAMGADLDLEILCQS